MRKLPSLTGLRAFEAAARLNSFVRAGEELGVSSAAVSLQVRTLEDHLGKTLFDRRGNRIALTDAGAELYPKLQHAFDDIGAVVDRVQNIRPANQLTISVLPSLADRWLMPRLTAYDLDTSPALSIRVEEDPVDLHAHRIDLRLTYQNALYPEFDSRVLFRDVAVPICAPSFWHQHGDPQGRLTHVPSSRLIRVNWGAAYASTPSWADWMHAAGQPRSDLTTAGMEVTDLTVAIDAATRGIGITLAPQSFVAPLLSDGQLVSPSDIHLPMAKPYVCLLRPERANHTAIGHLLTLLDAR